MDEGAPARLRRFAIGVLGMAAVPFILAAVAAAAFGYIFWIFALVAIIFFQGLYPAGGIGVWSSMALWFAYGVGSCYAAVRVMGRYPDISTRSSGALGLVVCWGWLLLTAALLVGWWLFLYPLMKASL
jgi:hypothetical protein